MSDPIATNMPVEFGLVGYPLSHSFSKQYFTQKFAEQGLHQYTYELYPLQSIDEFMPLVNSRPNLAGLNVTLPYKIAVLPFLHALSPEARATGAVNTIHIARKNGDTILTGHNTDVYGFEKSIKPFMESHHQRALVLGNGGASKAVQHVLTKLGIDFMVVSRNPEGPGQINYGEVNEYILKHHLFIINTTPLGMSPNVNECVPLMFEYIMPAHFLVDLVYNPAETLFLQKGKARGAKILNGLNMLHLQARRAFEIWTAHE